MSCLIVKCSALGDILQTFPVVSYLKERGLSVSWVCEERFEKLLTAHPEIDQVITINSKDWPRGLGALKNTLQATHYDYVFDLQGNCKSGLVTFLAKGKRKVGFTFKTASEWPNALVTSYRFSGNQPIDIVKGFFGDCSPFYYRGIALKNNDPIPCIPSPALMICPGSNWPNKQLDASDWKALLKDVSHHLVIIWGNEKEQELANEIAEGHSATVLGRLPFALWQALIREVDGVVGVDSSSVHLCATTNTPSFTIFGPSNPSIYKPSGEQHGFFWGTCPYQVDFKRRCPHLRTCKTGACTKAIPHSELIATFQSWLLDLACV
ncbi:MAG: hypothetical protein KDK44_01030 [Chlamydiia bacterium]|nr:hypothetical protein [Chlamydiia bacterium]MCP5508863.1 hypothetical protein [Chlamydiales bacterium]